MKRKQVLKEQIYRHFLKRAEAGDMMKELYRKRGMSSATYYAWKVKYGGFEVSVARRLRALEDENAKLKRLLADAMLDDARLKDSLRKVVGAGCAGRPTQPAPRRFAKAVASGDGIDRSSAA